MGSCVCIPEKEEDVYQYSTDKNTPYLSYNNIRKKVKIMRVIDGDTVDIAMIDDTKRIFKYRIRLLGIDTPEKKPLKSNLNRDAEIVAAKASTQAMINKLQENDNIITVQLHHPDKYGRLLGTFYGKNGEDINQWMIDSGYAIAYFGKTKKAFEVSENNVESE
jgi:endonuclease YncB( thermonuclease family)